MKLIPGLNLNSTEYNILTSTFDEELGMLETIIVNINVAGYPEYSVRLLQFKNKISVACSSSSYMKSTYHHENSVLNLGNKSLSLSFHVDDYDAERYFIQILNAKINAGILSFEIVKSKAEQIIPIEFYQKVEFANAPNTAPQAPQPIFVPYMQPIYQPNTTDSPFPWPGSTTICIN